MEIKIHAGTLRLMGVSKTKTEEIIKDIIEENCPGKKNWPGWANQIRSRKTELYLDISWLKFHIASMKKNLHKYTN